MWGVQHVNRGRGGTGDWTWPRYLIGKGTEAGLCTDQTEPKLRQPDNISCLRPKVHGLERRDESAAQRAVEEIGQGTHRITKTFDLASQIYKIKKQKTNYILISMWIFLTFQLNYMEYSILSSKLQSCIINYIECLYENNKLKCINFSISENYIKMMY